MKVAAVVAVAAAVLLAGCTSVVPAAPTPTLKDTTWLVTELNGAPTLADNQPTLSFDAAGQVSGNSGCNTVGGSYQLSGTKLSFGQLMQTEMACLDDGVMEQEQAFAHALGEVVGLRFVGDTVELLDADGAVALLLAPVPPLELAGTSWVLTGLIEGSSISATAEGDPVTLEFTADQLSGRACNNFNAGYSLDGDTIKISPIMSTKMACLSDELNRQEAFLFEVLESATTASSSRGTLELTAPDGRGLHFTKA